MSDTEPLSLEQLLDPQAIAAATTTTTSRAANTTTYLRCYYRQSTKAGDPRVAYVWGLDPAVSNSTTYYKLAGYWYSTTAFGVQNMFYSQATPASLNAVCASTYKKLRITGAHVQYSAANNSLSFDYAIWQNYATAQPTGAITNLISFGDSLSDVGNVFNGTNWLAPERTSWNWGRFSNGLLWVEHVKNSLNLSLYPGAVGGAGVQTQSGFLPGIVEQVNTWTNYAASANNFNVNNSLATIFIGGNDLISYKTTVSDMTSSVKKAADALLTAGVTKVLVIGLPDVSQAPQVRRQSDRQTIADNIISYNQNLQNLVNDYNTKGFTKVRFYDSKAYMDLVFKNPASYGLTNITDSCQNNTTGTNDYLKAIGLRPSCTDADQFAFWDVLHPSRKAHQLLGEAITTFIRNQYY